MQILAPAKVNVSLKILGRRNDDFHELDMLIAPISLYDEIRIEKRESAKGINFRCDDPSVPQRGRFLKRPRSTLRFRSS
jgi:4-diphosphocytidyl-2-C-methyl-D-erythritol kinase